MINFDGKEMQASFEVEFGQNIGALTAGQLWWLVKFAKHVRGRCRNNSAFNNYMNRNFSPARFKEIPKSYTDGRGMRKDYMGLQIEIDGQTSEGEE